MKPINTSIYDFPTLITGGYVYVDKTAQLYELAKPGADVLCYLPRPRRFGNPLMIPNQEVRTSLYCGYILRILGVTPTPTLPMAVALSTSASTMILQSARSMP